MISPWYLHCCFTHDNTHCYFMYWYHYYTESLVLHVFVSSLRGHSSSLDTVFHADTCYTEQCYYMTCTTDYTNTLYLYFIYLYHHYMNTLHCYGMYLWHGFICIQVLIVLVFLLHELLFVLRDLMIHASPVSLLHDYYMLVFCNSDSAMIFLLLDM